MQSEKIGELAMALAKAQGEIAPPKKGKTASIKSEKGSYSYNYADLADVIECYRPALSKNGLALTQAMRLQDGHIVLNTKILHSSDQWIDSDYPLQTYNRPQEQGSAITYARRYAACALLGIAAEDDDDGAAAQNAKPSEKAAKPSAPPAPAPKAELTNEEIVGIQTLAKQRGFLTPAALAPVLSNILPGVTKASDIQRKDLRAVMDALTAMREKVVA